MLFWQNKRVVVTGGAGFVGSHLVESLAEQGAVVTVIDSLETFRKWTPGTHIVRVDAGHASALVSHFEGADAVINLAASVAGVIYNQQNNLSMFERNIRLQVAPLLAAEQAGVARFLQVSSVCVYAPGYNNPALEVNGRRGEPVEANQGYSWAKRMGERAVEWAQIPYTITVRPSNMYGPRDNFGEHCHVVPALIKKALHDKAITLHGTGNEVREFLYVTDAVQGMLRALESGIPGEVYNLAGTQTLSMLSLAELIQHLTGAYRKQIIILGGDGGDDMRSSDARKTRMHLDWRARTDIRDGLEATIKWYREHY